MVPVLDETFSLLSNLIKPVEKKQTGLYFKKIISIYFKPNFVFFLIEPTSTINSELNIEKFYCDTMKDLQFGKKKKLKIVFYFFTLNVLFLQIVLP